MKRKYVPKKECRNNYHSFTVETKRCKHKHCSRCGVCQAENGCMVIIKNTENKLLESLNEQLDKWLKKRRQATIMVTDLANQIEEEEKRNRSPQKTLNSLREADNS